MAFVVEDGTVVANANSYCSLEFAASYFTDRGVVAWTGADDVLEAALIRATDYIEILNNQNFIGEQVQETQALSWPRQDAKYDGIIPVLLQKATAEYGLRALTSILAPDPVIDDTGRAVIKSVEKVGPIDEEISYAAGSDVTLIRPYPAADKLLLPLLAGRQFTLVRN